MNTNPRIVVWHGNADAYCEALEARLPDVPIEGIEPDSSAATLLEAAASGDAAALPEAARFVEAEVVLAWKMPAGVLRSFPALRWVQVTGAGVDHFLSRDDLPADLPLTRSLGRFGLQVSEYVVGYLLQLLLGIETYRQQQADRVWEQGRRPLLTDRTVGILGLGSLGLPTARTLSALGSRVIAATRSGNPVDGVDQVLDFGTWRDLLPQCDALVLAVPLTTETEGMIDASALSALPRGAVLINVARGDLIDEAALLDALDREHLGAAVLDVFAVEPLPADHPLWEHSRAWITPHIAAPSELDAMIDEFVVNFEHFLEGRELINLVSRERGY